MKQAGVLESDMAFVMLREVWEKQRRSSMETINLKSDLAIRVAGHNQFGRTEQGQITSLRRYLQAVAHSAECSSGLRHDM